MTPRTVAPPRADAQATGQAIPSSADFVASANVLLGAVGQLRVDMSAGFERIETTLGSVCLDVATLKTDRAVDAAVAAAAAVAATNERAAAEQHTLSWRWRAGIAAGIAGTFALALAQLITGH